MARIEPFNYVWTMTDEKKVLGWIYPLNEDDEHCEFFRDNTYVYKIYRKDPENGNEYIIIGIFSGDLSIICI